jgi:hypothetical protein
VGFENDIAAKEFFIVTVKGKGGERRKGKGGKGTERKGSLIGLKFNISRTGTCSAG